MAQGKEKYSKGLTDVSGRDGFYRNNISVGRWSYGADVFKTNFAKLIGINLLMLVFIAPIVYFLLVRSSQQYTLAHQAPFTANIGVGYAPFPNLLAQEESITLSINTSFFLWLPVMGLWLSFGLSGALYVMRNLCWGEDVSIIKDFFLGIRRNFFPVLIVTLLFTLIFASAWIGVSYVDYIGAKAGGKVWYQVVVKILMIIAMVFASLWYLSMLPMSVTYKGNVFSLLKNGLLITGVLLPVNAFYAAFAALPFVFLLLGNTFFVLGLLVVALIGISFSLLVWTLYSQWIYDKFINPTVRNKYKPSEAELKAKKAREEARASLGEEEGYETVEGTRKFASAAKPITDVGVKVEELPEYYTFADIEKLKESKKKMKDDAKEYSADPEKYRGTHKGEFEFEDDEPIEEAESPVEEPTEAEETPAPEKKAKKRKNNK